MQRPITDGVCGLHGSLAKGARTDQGRGLISCKAPATISAADAVPSTTSGLPCDWSSPGRAGRGIFSKLARSALRQIRVASKQELRQRILDAIEDANRDPVVHAWTYKIDQAA